jgi:putative transposase
MRRSHFTEAQIIGLIKEQGAGLPTPELCRKHGLSPSTFYKLGLQAQLRQLGASFPVFLSGGVRKVNVLAAFGKAFR